MDKISVIIPAYNAEKYITEAINSIRIQPLGKDAEIIVIDDGSTDNTVKIVESMESVVLLHQAHKGPAPARNLGIEKSSGNLIYLLDADDISCENALDNLHNLLTEEVFAAFGLVEDFITPEISDEEKAKLSVRPQPYGGQLTGGSLIKKSAFGTVGKFKEDYLAAETVDWSIRFRESGLKQAETSEIVLKRRIHPTSSGRLNRQSQLKDYAAILRARMKMKH